MSLSLPANWWDYLSAVLLKGLAVCSVHNKQAWWTCTNKQNTPFIVADVFQNACCEVSHSLTVSSAQLVTKEVSFVLNLKLAS